MSSGQPFMNIWEVQVCYKALYIRSENKAIDNYTDQILIYYQFYEYVKYNSMDQA
jgi:hypothetical protein